jgi:hypothetical protein
MLHRFLAHISFLWHSKNEHGVHSPFIFRYVTICLSQKKRYSGHKIENILLKNVAYFLPESVVMTAKNPALETLIREQLSQARAKQHPLPSRLVYISALDRKNLSDHLFENRDIGPETVVLIQGIHQTRESSSLWELIKQWDRVTVTVDMFYCAAVFFREGQAKQHFRIRI